MADPRVTVTLTCVRQPRPTRGRAVRLAIARVAVVVLIAVLAVGAWLFFSGASAEAPRTSLPSPERTAR